MIQGVLSLSTLSFLKGYILQKNVEMYTSFMCKELYL